jgi:hypothetical protein
VTPLELWDLQIGERILWDIMLEPSFPAIFREIIEGLHRGEGETRSQGRVPAAIAGFDSVYVAGRRSGESAIRSNLAALGLPVVFSRTPDFPGGQAGMRFLDRSASSSGWVCDLGQTSFKISARTQRMTFARDLKRLPIRTGAEGQSTPQQRRELREWLAESLRAFAQVVGAPDALLFALPSRLDDVGIPEGSSYIGMENDRSLIADVIDTGGVHLACLRQVWVMNDAELAALDARAEPALRECTKTLVLTLGFGVGAALAFSDGGDRHA